MDGNKPDNKFNEILLVSVDEALSTFGESVKTSIYFHLENTFSLPKHEIPLRIEDFSNALERIFGLGARHLEILIMRNLNQKTESQDKTNKPNWLASDFTFGKYVEKTRISFEDSSSLDITVMVDMRESITIKTKPKEIK
ncbi:MAG TPA: hypothetical protein VMD05_03355 [Candidatus Nanoarchaeia archaeon]|nr:hypothetical protein [Candidatus Nanoarchaeia archaeon]